MVRAVESIRLSDFGRRLRLVTESCFDIAPPVDCFMVSQVQGHLVVNLDQPSLCPTATIANRGGYHLLLFQVF